MGPEKPTRTDALGRVASAWLDIWVPGNRRWNGLSGTEVTITTGCQRKPQGDGARGISAQRFEIPLAGGAGARIVTALLAGTRRVPAWGEPSPPRLSLGGNGKGG